MTVYIPVRGADTDQSDPEFERFLADFKNMVVKEGMRNLVDETGRFQEIISLEFKTVHSRWRSKRQDKTIRQLGRTYEFFKTVHNDHYLKMVIHFKYPFYEMDKNIGIRLNFIISKISLLVNITYATKVDFLTGVVISETGDYLDSTRTLLSSIDYAHEHAAKLGWPILKGLKLDDVVSWYSSRNLHIDDVSVNKLHRAINAFSYQFSAILEKDTSILFWTMLGIEALLAEGSNNINNQIKVKSSLILGEPSEYKKKLDRLYNYRSRFVHGDINFPAKFSGGYESFEKEYYDYLSFATSILLALIRTLIISQKTEFKFEYKIV